jgi:hypothetical protein
MQEPDLSKARVRLGPLALNPTIELTNFGVDTNVFNAPAGLEQRDFTFTLSPRTDAWMRLGRTWLSGNAREDIVWYQKYSSERAANSFLTGGWAVPLNRLVIGLGVDYLTARERPGFEIDARAHRREFEYKGAVEGRIFARTLIGVRAGRRKVEFDQDETFANSSLQVELNRTVTTESATVRQELTPLTSLTFDVGRQQDRFEFSDLRDSDSTTVGMQVVFDPSALIQGSARIGYRNFEPLSSTLPGFKGATVNVDLGYTLLGTTKFKLQGGRDVQYSYDVNQPYYLQTGINATIAQQIFGPVDAMFRVGVEHLAYRDRTGAIVAVPNRVDTLRTYGGGVGYHLGPDVRIGFNVDKQQRDSDLFGRQFEGLRYWASVTYGL